MNCDVPSLLLYQWDRERERGVKSIFTSVFRLVRKQEKQRKKLLIIQPIREMGFKRNASSIRRIGMGCSSPKGTVLLRLRHWERRFVECLIKLCPFMVKGGKMFRDLVTHTYELWRSHGCWNPIYITNKICFCHKY